MPPRALHPSPREAPHFVVEGHLSIAWRGDARSVAVVRASSLSRRCPGKSRSRLPIRRSSEDYVCERHTAVDFTVWVFRQNPMRALSVSQRPGPHIPLNPEVPKINMPIRVMHDYCYDTACAPPPTLYVMYIEMYLCNKERG